MIVCDVLQQKDRIESKLNLRISRRAEKIRPPNRFNIVSLSKFKKGKSNYFDTAAIKKLK